MHERTVSITAARPLRTARLLLRAYQPSDLPWITDLLGREEVCRYLPWPPMSPEQAGEKLAQRLLQTGIGPEQEAMVPVAVEAATGRVVGEFMLRARASEHGNGEMGWSLHPDFHGRGFATEGAHELLRVGFEDLGLHRIRASADARNVASIRVMERLGMRPEAHFVKSELIKGEWVDEVVYAILASEWRASTA
jgi:RimJ/RimL family protein N-acetyltransferase